MRTDFSQRVLAVFANHQTNAEQMSQLMKDVALGHTIYDDVTKREISKAEANEKIYAFSCEVLGVNKNSTKKEIRRALRDNGQEWFDIIEDTVDLAISTGFGDSPWFEALVEYKNINYGDRQDFYSEEEAVLAVAKIGESHHDHILQRIGAGQTISIPTARYDVKIGADINKFIVNQVDWAKMIQAISNTYAKKIQALVYAELTNVSASLPAAVVGSGALNNSSKDTFNEKIDNVSDANDGAEVIIMGTKPALRKITGIADVDWGSANQKDNVAETGIIGIYEGYRLVLIPNRFEDKTLTTKVMSDKKLYFMPVIDGNKPIKFVDEGDTEITSVESKGEANGRLDDLMSYEVQRRMGAGVVLGRIMGEWTLP